jgi:hypothetical protein
MKVRSVVLTVLLIAGLVAGVPSQAANVYGGSEVVIAVIDTGLRATHQEFDYQGPSSTTDQIVAWWDFSDELGAVTLPGSGDLWDSRREPFDGHGHGTATASLAAGRNAAGPSVKDPSFAPGYKLAIAKVGTSEGAISGNVAAAIRWAVDTVHADVISISIGFVVPLPDLVDETHEAARYARQAGSLVTVSNGNGFLNFGIPGDPGWASPFGDSTEVLSVGASGIDGPFTHTDPEVVAKFFDTRVASNGCDTCYTTMTGTSFSNPLVAGMAARLMAEAIANGRPASPGYVETLLKYSARDTIITPNWEGYGVLDGTQISNVALSHAAAGTLPTRPNPDISGLYVETVSGGLRDVWSNKLDGGLRAIASTGIPSGSGPAAVGTSAPTGLSEAEVHTFSATAGQTVSIDLGYVLDPLLSSVNDVDLYVFRGSAPVLSGLDLVAKSARAAGENESVTFRSPAAGTYSVVVLGWSVAGNQSFTLSGVPLTFVDDDYALHTFGL